MEIKLIRQGAAHSFGWQRRRELDQPNLFAWEDCQGIIHFADKSHKVVSKVIIGRKYTLSPMVYEYQVDGIKTQTLVKPV